MGSKIEKANTFNSIESLNIRPNISQQTDDGIYVRSHKEKVNSK